MTRWIALAGWMFLASPLAADSIDEMRQRLRLDPDLPFEATVEARTPDRTEAALGVSSWRVRFPSPVTTAVERNNTVDAVLFVPRAGSKAAVIFLPWFKDPDTTNAETICRVIAAAGFEVLFVPMGYQFGRAPEGYGSGSYITKGPPEHIQEWARQAVLDTQRARHWFVRDRKIDPRRVGLVGISLGGFVSALTYGVCPEFEAAAVCLAGGNLARWVEIGHDLGIEAIGKELAKHGVGVDDLPDLVRPYDPVTYADPARKDGLLLVNGVFDPIVPFPVAQDLWKAWGEPNRLLLPSGHVTTVAFTPVLLLRLTSHLRERLLD